MDSLDDCVCFVIEAPQSLELTGLGKSIHFARQGSVRIHRFSRVLVEAVRNMGIRLFSGRWMKLHRLSARQIRD